jgi:iron(III) transport system substrate-binding protein
MTRLLTLLTLVLATVVLAACGSDDDGGGSAGDRSSGDENELVLYSGRNQDLVGELLERYQKETGTKLEIRYSDSADLAATLLEEGDNSPADVFLSQDAGALGALQKEGRLADLPASVLEEVDQRYRSTEGKWVGLTARARVIAFDKRQLEASDLPDSVLDLTDPKWKGKIGWAPTNPSFESFVTALRKLRGDDEARAWLEGMVANDTRAYPNNIAVRDAIANGEIEAGLINHYYVAEAIAAEGDDYPVGLFFPPGGDPGSLVNVSGAAILASSERKEKAQELVRWLLGRTAQTYFAGDTKEYPLAAGVRPDPALEPLARIEQPDIDLADLDDLQGSVKMIQEAGAL